MHMERPMNSRQQLKGIHSRFIPPVPFADRDGKDFNEKQACKQSDAASTLGYGMGREEIP
jgi:hypothetical protein